MTAIPVLCGMAVLSVDFGRVQLAKSEIQAATDAAVRAAGQKMIETDDISVILASAVGAASSNRVDGQPVVVRASNLKIGVYDTANKTFVETGTPKVANAIRVNLSYEFGTDGPALTFASVIGGGTKRVSHRATVKIGDEPDGWDYSKWRTWVPGTDASAGEVIVTESTVAGYYAEIQAERDRLAKEEADRLAAEAAAAQAAADKAWQEEYARQIAARDAAELANPQLKIDRLAREEADRIAYEQWAAAEAARLEAERLAAEEWARTHPTPVETSPTTGTDGYWTDGSTVTTTPAPKKTVTQLE